MEYAIYSMLILTGLAMGSFAGAQVWRLRAHQITQDAEYDETITKKEKKQLSVLNNKKTTEDRSLCLSCHHELRWYDLFPLFSWLSTKGKCRYCDKSIGFFEPIMELLTMTLFVVSYAVWPFGFDGWLNIVAFVLWLLATVLMMILLAYDAKWFLLPDSINFSLAAVGLLFAVSIIVAHGFEYSKFISLIGSVAVLSGVYAVLYYVSGGRWIGFGDVKLGIGLGLLLQSWEYALLALFLANLLGTIVILPLMASKKVDRKTHIPFGPFLIFATYIAVLFGGTIIQGYLSFSLLFL